MICITSHCGWGFSGACPDLFEYQLGVPGRDMECTGLAEAVVITEVRPGVAE